MQDLLNVSSITSVTVGGKSLVVDGAQTQTGLYFQNLLLNASPEPYLTDFFGTAKPVPANVGNIGKQYKSFFEAKAVMNLGQLVHDNFATSKPDAVKRIAIDKINQAWKDLGKDEGYAAVSQGLYIEGYRDGVPGMPALFGGAGQMGSGPLQSFAVGELSQYLGSAGRERSVQQHQAADVRVVDAAQHPAAEPHDPAAGRRRARRQAADLRRRHAEPDVRGRAQFARSSAPAGPRR